MTFLQSLFQNKKRFFLFAWAVIAIIYLPSWKAGFVADFMNALIRYHEGSFSYFINREGAYVRSLYQVTQLELYAIISLFGTQPIPWFILFTGLHALNGTLVYSFFSNFFKDLKLSNGGLIALAGTGLFLLNPNITEVTIWKGGYHYLTGVLMQMLVLIWGRKYLLTRQTKYAWYAGVLFAISTYTLEIFYITPALTLFLIFSYYSQKVIDKTGFSKGVARLFLPQLLLFLLHLITFRIIYGSWIAHYGSTADFAQSYDEWWPRIGKYLAYLLLMAGRLPDVWRSNAYAFFSRPDVYIPLLALIIYFIIYIGYRFRKASPPFQAAGFLFLAAIVSLVLVIPIYFDDSFSLYNSRRSYHTGLFIYMLFALLLFQLIANRRIALAIFFIYLAGCVVLTEKMVIRWRKATKIQHGILRTFHWQDSPKVLLLNTPTYYRDVRIIPAGEYNEFAKQLKVFGKDTMRGQLYSVSSYNMQNPWDGAHVTVLDSMTIKVTLNQWGTWWMYNYQGATNYETDLYKVEYTDPSHEYLLKFKTTPKDAVILYEQGEQWRKVDMSRIGVEQYTD
jgi:hypothetical protein